MFVCVWFCSVRFRFVPFRSVRFGSVRFGSVRFGSVRFGSVRFGSARLGSVRFDSIGHVLAFRTLGTSGVQMYLVRVAAFFFRREVILRTVGVLYGFRSPW